MESTKPCPGLWFGLQVFADFAINGNSFGPTGWSIPSTHYVAGKEFDASQQTTHSAHVVVPIASNLVVQLFQNEHFVVKRLKRFEDRLVLKVFTVSFRPELIGYGTVGAEHHDQPLLGY